MSKSTPSLMAPLGLGAVAGYQDRDRLSSLLARARDHAAPPARQGPGPDEGQGGVLADLAATFNHGAANGGGLAGGIGKRMNMFRCTGQETAAESRVAVDRENESIGPEDLERAIGPEMVVELRQKTGLSRSEILSRLAATLPQMQKAASCGAALCVMSQRLAAPVAPCAHRLERDADMGIAIGFASLRGKAAEPEVVRRRIANRPFAGAFGQFHQA